MRLLLLLSVLTVSMYANSASAETITTEYVGQVTTNDASWACVSDVVVVDTPYYYEQEYPEYYYDTYVEDVGYDYSANTGVLYPYAYEYYYDVVIEENCDEQLDGALLSADVLIANAAAYVQAMQQHILQMIGQIMPFCACSKNEGSARDTVTTSLACEQAPDGYDYYDYYDYDYYDYYYDAATPTPTCAQVAKGCIMKAFAQAKSFGIGMASGAAMGAFESEYMHPILAPFDDKTVVGLYGAALGTAGATAYAAKDTCVGKEFKKPATMVGVLAGLLAWYHCMGEGIGL